MKQTNSLLHKQVIRGNKRDRDLGLYIHWFFQLSIDEKSCVFERASADCKTLEYYSTHTLFERENEGHDQLY
jgi:hypothetical protein